MRRARNLALFGIAAAAILIGVAVVFRQQIQPLLGVNVDTGGGGSGLENAIPAAIVPDANGSAGYTVFNGAGPPFSFAGFVQMTSSSASPRPNIEPSGGVSL